MNAARIMFRSRLARFPPAANGKAGSGAADGPPPGPAPMGPMQARYLLPFGVGNRPLPGSALWYCRLNI
jgi:hypothetical protein